MADQIEAPQEYNPPEDADGFSCWLSIADTHFERTAALAALMSAAKLGFKFVIDDSTGWTYVHVKKPDRKAMEVIWNFTAFVKVESPPVLKINIRQPDPIGETMEIKMEEIEPYSRFDVI